MNLHDAFIALADVLHRHMSSVHPRTKEEISRDVDIVANAASIAQQLKDAALAPSNTQGQG